LKRIVLAFLCLPLCLFAQDQVQLDPSLRHAVDLVGESWNALDTVISEVWPGWDTYRDEIYFTAIPGVQDILINPPADPGGGYTQLEITLDGRAVYVRTPSPLERIWGGAHRFRLAGKRFKAAQFHPMSREYSDKVCRNLIKRLHWGELPEGIKKLNHSAEFYMRMIIHEAFHRWQENLNKAKIVNAEHPSPHSVSPRHDLFLELEGKILADALQCSDRVKLIRLSQKFLFARKERRGFLTEKDIQWERRNEFMEGSAQYVEYKTYLALNDITYKPKYLQAGANGFSHFTHGDALRKLLDRQVRETPKNLHDPNEALIWPYYFGLAQGFILDRLCGHKWKENFFEDGVYFETLLAERCGFDLD
jgi:hypothetical protein